MRLRYFIVLLLTTAGLSAQQAVPLDVQVANMREDLRGLIQRVGELSLRVENLERENQALQEKLGGAAQNYVTMDQLTSAVADLNRALKSAQADTRADISKQVNKELEKLAQQTNAAINSLAKGMARREAIQTNFSNDFSQSGVSYTVQKGDTLSSIAQQTGANVRDIINANKITDPAKIRVGETLFIPTAKK